MRGYNKNIFKDRTFLTLAGVSVLAVCGIVGSVMMDNEVDSPEPGYIANLDDTASEETTYFNNSAVSGNDATASEFSKKSNETTETETNSSAVNDSLVTNEENGATDLASNNSKNKDSASPDTSDETDNSEVRDVASLDTTAPGNDEPEVEASGSEISGFSFSEKSVLKWPVETSDIIIDFSPESTVYYATLDKYKTSNAISIRSEIDSPVYSSAAGTVCDIGYDEEIGNSVSVNLGNDYIIQYGQIKDIQVDEGDTVAAGDLLCYVANPTKYYTVEGPNLYLKLTSSDKPVDPTNYLDY